MAESLDFGGDQYIYKQRTPQGGYPLRVQDAFGTFCEGRPGVPVAAQQVFLRVGLCAHPRAISLTEVDDARPTPARSVVRARRTTSATGVVVYGIKDLTGEHLHPEVSFSTSLNPHRSHRDTTPSMSRVLLPMSALVAHDHVGRRKATNLPPCDIPDPIRWPSLSPTTWLTVLA